VQDLASEEHAKVLTLQQEKERLKTAEQMNEELKTEVERLHDIEEEVEQYRRMNINPKDWAMFITNKDAIRHYLKLVPMLIEWVLSICATHTVS
jgi:cell shape-determining protein MreC